MRENKTISSRKNKSTIISIVLCITAILFAVAGLVINRETIQEREKSKKEVDFSIRKADISTDTALSKNLLFTTPKILELSVSDLRHESLKIKKIINVNKKQEVAATTEIAISTDIARASETTKYFPKNQETVKIYIDTQKNTETTVSTETTITPETTLSSDSTTTDETTLIQNSTANIETNTQIAQTQTTTVTPETTSVPTENKTNKIRFKLTAYCPCSRCSGKWGKQTSTGAIAKQGVTIAVCPSQIPYGSRVTIDGYGTYIAQDCGVGKNQIDIYFDSHADTVNFGVKYAYVSW